MLNFVRISLAALVLSTSLHPAVSAQDSTPTANSAERTFSGLEVYPTEIVLGSIRDARRILVTGVTTSGQRIDLTSKATLTAISARCAVTAGVRGNSWAG